MKKIEKIAFISRTDKKADKFMRENYQKAIGDSDIVAYTQSVIKTENHVLSSYGLRNFKDLKLDKVYIDDSMYVSSKGTIDLVEHNEIVELMLPVVDYKMDRIFHI